MKNSFKDENFDVWSRIWRLSHWRKI